MIFRDTLVLASTTINERKTILLNSIGFDSYQGSIGSFGGGVVWALQYAVTTKAARPHE